MTQSFKGQLALITGASQGIGFAIARALAAEGCNLVLGARDRTRLDRARAELSNENFTVVALTCDVGNEKSVADMIQEIRKSFSRIDILINCAGIAPALRPIAELSTKEWNDVIATNLTGTFLVNRASLPLM